MDFLSSITRQGELFLERLRCPLCSSATLTPFLHRSNVPVLTNLLMNTQRDARHVQRGTIHLVLCGNCGFIFNSAFEASALYDQQYDNSQVHAPSFERYLDALVHSLTKEQQIQQCQIVEVGCGDGFFLRKLVEAGVGNKGYGFDPSYRGPAYACDGRIQFEARYYDETCRNISADVLICRHVIEHISRPLPFLRTLHNALAGSSQSRAFFETPTIEWILQNMVLWDIYYEHCSYFSADTITHALELSGFRVEHIKRTFNDQYLWVEARVADPKQIPYITMIESDSMPSFTSQFQSNEQLFSKEWQQTIQVLRQDGPVALLGAAGKGVTLANLIDPDGQLISCIVDLNPQKQQKFLPGTGHPIVSYKEMKAYGIASAVLLNPNYYEDTIRLFAHHQMSIKLITDTTTAQTHTIHGEQSKKTPLELLVAQVEHAHHQGKTIVFTNGVFDLLHAGHVQFLRYAKTLGDILIVAIDNDASTRRLKGIGRPINNERDRMMLVTALDMVDYTFLFESEMLPELIRTLHPQIYVKGNEYHKKPSSATDVLHSIGGRSIIAPLFGNDLHTSQIIERILTLALNK